MTTAQSTPLRPSEKRALELWDSLPEGARSYKAVAALYTKGDGATITEGRASGYVREALTKSGRTDELPTRGRTNTERTTASVPINAPTSVDSMVEAMIGKLRQSIEQAEQRSTKAREEAEAFDAEAFRQGEQDRRTEAVKEAQARLKAWKDDKDGEATKAAEAAEKALTDRADRVQADVEAATEQMRTELDKYERVEAMMAELLETADAE